MAMKMMMLSRRIGRLWQLFGAAQAWENPSLLLLQASFPRSAHTISPLLAKPPVSSSEVDSGEVILERLRDLGLNNSTMDSFALLPSPSLATQWAKVQLLMDKGFTQAELKQLLGMAGFKIIVQTSPSKILSQLNFLGESANRVVSRRPQYLAMGLTNLESKLEFFQSLGLERDRCMTILEVFPSVVNANLESLQRRVAYLQGMGMGAQDLPKLVRRFPNVLSTEVESQVDFLTSRGVKTETIRRCALSSPQFLTISIRNLSEKFEFFEKLGFDKNSDRFIRVVLRLCGLSRELLQARFDWLLSRGFSDRDAIRIVEIQPTVLQCREELLGKKVDLLVNVLNRDIQEIVKYPSFLLFSLEHRIMPRFNVLTRCEEQGMLEGDVSLRSVLGCSSKQFQEEFVDHPPKKRKRWKTDLCCYNE